MNRFTQQLLEIGKWMQAKKRFIWLSTDYVVVSMTMEEYKEKFQTPKKGDNNIFIFEDEYNELSDDQWELLERRIKDK